MRQVDWNVYAKTENFI
ncbi:hypothetical protein [Ureibacillus acetophenoni]